MALARAARNNERLGEALIAQRAVTRDDVLRALATQSGLPFLSREEFPTFPTSPSASGVAGFTIGIYVLLVILAALSLEHAKRRRERPWPRSWASYIDDYAGVANRHFIGVDRIMWSSDYPHQASSWPHSQDVVARDFKDATPEERFTMTRGNVARLYGFDA